ncbi:membrane protein [Streptococcus varani]|jgi:uncharacterized membrane protein YjjP (DUF1212 family)|uniref:Membrane protein n=1 Tax=Streptococcus varani TaxID=1608583 RepID=A0A0E3WFL3_9STRE|nr:membrane protein [Streptococcus varani]
MDQALNKSSIEKELEATLLAGRLLMESGAEIYRIEETMFHIARAFGLAKFEVFVISRGIFASALNQNGFSEAKVNTTKETFVNLRKLEEINRLSRRLSAEKNMSADDLIEDLNAIDNKNDYAALPRLFAYFLGAGSFAFALGSSWQDSLVSAVTGLLIGVSLHFVHRFIKTDLILTIIGSIVATLSVNLMHLVGIGEYRGLIILGALMVLVPGAFFVNSIREFSQNNYATGLSLMVSALLTCISISVGVAATIEALPFADQMTGVFSVSAPTIGILLQRSLMAGIGTISFSLLYSTPKRFFLDLGLLGGTTWMLYLLLLDWSHFDVVAIFLSSLLVIFSSRFLAVKRKSPASIFLSTSMFPLIPGISFYRAVYFLLTGSNDLAMEYLRTSFVTAFTIALAIIIVQQFPMKLFPRKS